MHHGDIHLEVVVDVDLITSIGTANSVGSNLHVLPFHLVRQLSPPKTSLSLSQTQ
jgi:hypothetical protein